MPSRSLLRYKNELLVDVNRLVESHNSLKGTGPGRRGLGHITRSGVLMLCAAWEQYIESILIESAEFLIDCAPLPSDLPLNAQKEIAKAVRNSKHELRPLDLAGDGWKTVYIDHLKSVILDLNTPKTKEHSYFSNI